MQKSSFEFRPTPLARLMPGVCMALLLSACGGDGSTDTASSAGQASASLATGNTTLALENVALPETLTAQTAEPLFHLAPVLLDSPADADTAAGEQASPHQQTVAADLSDVDTTRLTVQQMRAGRFMRATQKAAGDATPAASTSTAVTYNPAQIRAAYGMSALSTSTSGLSTAQAAALGAGQTIYIVDAQHDPNAAAELATFNQKFALPTCTTKAIAATTALPLATASASACEFSVVYTTASGTMTATAPAYNSGWATEIALDVQWAHAIAPLARIVLLEAPDASLNSLLGAVKVANAMGPGVVSMSFGANEGNWTSSVDSAFTVNKMTYLAATGDSGAAVSWPAVSSNVVAVGGTSLTWSGTGSRSESAWSGTGGGVSAYVSTPAYQNNKVPGLGTPAHRSVADVAFNADPYTGQYVAVLAPGATTASWVSAGGTSLSTPQWAGLITVANALRAAGSKAPLGAPHTALYQQIGAVAGTYASVFADITKGSDGTCSTCVAKAGYDTVSGLGTPNVSSLLSSLSGSTAATPAPVVTAASISGTVGTALTFTLSATGANTLSYSLSGAPAGMTVNSSGTVSWPTPVAGSYAVTATAKDSVTGQTGSAVYAVTVAAAQPPLVSSATISGRPGTALSFQVAVSSSNPVTYTLAGAPAGMTISTLGVINWASPVLGNYAVTVTAKDSKTGITGKGVYTLQIANAGPVITATGSTGVAGTALTGTIGLADAGATWLRITIDGAPLGMTFAMSGPTLIYSWAKPVAGNYPLKLTVVDNRGLTTQATVLVAINAR
ncbi:S53 family peptidase [Amantichitinum ursilacus]|uniref:Pseudomonalisin n=1 Tax=Amantichitinum ursilacus TaxID=857265 RepID=A0A0N0GPI5_9NEIS|nr:S53 family peptidase [Amantichitinum ursilacus]KPC53733.1 Pseudomonalisin precursor [Amantichitinum ursilacus]